MMKYPLGTLQHKLELQPDRDANTLVAMGQWANRLIVGTDTGSTRRIHFYEPRQDMRQFINDVGVDTQLDGEFNALAMSHDGHRIACGDMYNNLPSGAVYLFNVVAGDTQYGLPTNYELTPLATLTLNPVVADAYFGAACCFYNATGGVFVGAPGVANDRGSVFLFEQVGGVWTNTQEIPGPAGADGFGTAVSISNSGSLLAVGAGWADNYWGRAYIYEQDGDGIYQLRDILEPGNDGGQFGQGIAISHDGLMLFVGTPTYSDIQARQGCIQVYLYREGAWVRTENRIRATAWGWEHLGLNLAIAEDGQQLMAGMACSAMLYDVYRYRLGGTILDDNGNPIAQEVRVHDSYSGELVNICWSDETTGAWEIATVSDGPNCVICHDTDEAGVFFNAQVYDWVTPL
jgi:hypothetical protein